MCPDTVEFLNMLHHLGDEVAEDADPPELPERQAARSLFRWEVSPSALPSQPLLHLLLPQPCSFLLLLLLAVLQWGPHDCHLQIRLCCNRTAYL